MGDDGCSASDLRRRYHMGGELKDDHLTAPQLRARYGIKKNTAGTYIGATSIIWSVHFWQYIAQGSRLSQELCMQGTIGCAAFIVPVRSRVHVVRWRWLRMIRIQRQAIDTKTLGLERIWYLCGKRRRCRVAVSSI